MKPQTQLEITGNLSEHPLAELLLETSEANLSGSFRLSQNEQKTIIYLDEGRVVFAVSNLRQHRLFALLISENLLSKERLSDFPNPANDLELSNKLVEENIISQKEIDELTVRQIEEIIKFCLPWNSGEWNFNSLARIKEGINFEIDLNELLLNFARNLAPDKLLERFASIDESFAAKADLPLNINIQAHEAFVFSRFEKEFLAPADLDKISGLPENDTRRVLYSLWLGGFLHRQNWNSAFTENKIATILTAKLQRVEEVEPKKTENLAVPVEAEEKIIEQTKVAEAEEITEVDEEKLLDEYLKRVESATTLYEVIGVELESEESEVKKAYFAQAKKYHPDLFYKNEEFHPRMQSAFTKLAHAYETLKSQDTRDLYNFRMRKELTAIKEREEAGMTQEEAKQDQKAGQAADFFEAGLEFLQENMHEDAVPCFARAVHFDENDARYRAFYGKALSFSKKNLHQAESEIQAAVKIDPENPIYRLMLAELFIQIGLKKRAEGELNRLLEIAPNDRDALALLDSLQNK